MNDQETVANPGLLRPPLIYLVAVVVGFTLHMAWPFALPLQPWPMLVGVTLLIVGNGLIVLTLKTFKQSATPFPGNQAVTQLIDTGPFRFSRNPAYIAFTGIATGVGLIVNSVWILIALTGAIVVMNHVVIPREEAYLSRRFGKPYRDYVRRVRRWL